MGKDSSRAPGMTMLGIWNTVRDLSPVPLDRKFRNIVLNNKIVERSNLTDRQPI
jgi:hypothetical protein